MYLYKTIIYKIPDEVVGLTDSEIVQHQGDKIDFEANFKVTAVKADEVVLAETTFVIGKTYVEFKNLIDGTLRTWADVKYTEDNSRFTLHLLTGGSL
ncbi:MAG: hypothetical protein HYT11_00855 [Candidatus Levybacteria bacterium]|nr:hypothetical protein [Candidatus Levybacteria bacterium]